MRSRRPLARVVEWLAECCGRGAFLQDLEDGRVERRQRGSAEQADGWYRRQLRRSFLPLAVDLVHSTTRRVIRDIAGDGRSAVRALLASPGLSITVVVVLSLGVGASSAVYGTLRAILLRPLPYEEPERLVSLNTFAATRDTTLRGIAGPDYFEQFDALDSYEGIAAFESFRAAVSFGDAAERLDASSMTRSALAVLGVRPVLGRGFSADEDGAEPLNVVLISERLWRRHFEAGEVVGRSLSLDGTPYSIIGVAPDELALAPERVDVWLPMGRRPARYNRRAPILAVVGRLAAGTSLEQAREEIEALDAELSRRYPETHSDRRFFVAPLIDVVVGQQRGPLAILSLASLALLLVSAGNAASLQLGRWHARRREIATRHALGATRGRLLRQFALENGILGLVACGPGLLLAAVLLQFVPRFAPPRMPRIEDVALDPTVVVAALIAAIVSTAAGLLPMAVRSLVDRERPAVAGCSSAAGGTEMRGLIVIQVAVSAVLVASSAALLGVVGEVLDRDRGVDSERLLVARVDLPASRYPTGMSRYPNWPEVLAFHDAVLDGLAAQSGVAGVAVGSAPPAGRAAFRTGIDLEGAHEEIRAVVQHVSVRWGEVVGQRILGGRDFGDHDTAESRRVAVANRALAALAGGTDSTLGQRFALYGSTWEIVGVATDTDAVGQVGMPAVMLPFRQAPVEWLTVAVRTEGPPLQLADSVRTVVRALDPELALYEVGTLEAMLRAETTDARFVALLVGAFGVVGVVLGGAGVLGSLMRSVVARRREMGIRLALGARPRMLLAAVVGEGATLVVIGLALALPIVAAAWGRLVAVSPEAAALPHARLAATAGAILVAAVLASLAPAWRAATTDPTLSIKADR